VSARALLVLIVLLAAVIGALYWLGRKPEPAASAGPDAPLLSPFTEGQVKSVTIDCEGRTAVLARDAARGWRVERPFAAEADPRRVHDILAALQDARVRRVVAEHGDAAGFGLQPAACTTTVAMEGDRPAATVRLGRTSPVGTERYTATASGAIALTDGSIFGALAGDPERFRERRLIPVDAEAITRIALTRPAGRLVLASSEGRWRIEAPFADAASSGAVGQLARAIASIELSDTGQAARPIRPRADRSIAIEVTVPPGGVPLRAFVAGAGEAGKRLGWRDEGEMLGLVGEQVASELTRPADAFRDLRVATFSTPDVRRIEIARGETMKLERASESAAWSASDAKGAFTPDPGAIDALLDRLRVLTAVEVEAKPPTTPASGSVSIAGAAGELARLTWGPLAPPAGSTEESVWITTPSRPGVVFRVPAVSFGPIPKDRASLVK